MNKKIWRELTVQGTNPVLSPDLDLLRELPSGRLEETSCKDPYLTSHVGVAFVKGFNEIDIICTPKHFAAHGSPSRGLNLTFNAVRKCELGFFYLKRFEAIIKEADVFSIMNAYSSYDYVSMAASHHVLTDIHRKELGSKASVYFD